MKHDRVAVTPTRRRTHAFTVRVTQRSFDFAFLFSNPNTLRRAAQHTTTGNRCIQQQRASGTRTQTPRTLCAPSAPPPTHRNGYPAARLSRRAVGSAPRHQAASGAGSHSPRPPRARSTHNLLSAGPGALAHRMRHRHTGTPASFLPHALIRRARERGTARLDNGSRSAPALPDAHQSLCSCSAAPREVFSPELRAEYGDDAGLMTTGQHPSGP